MTTTARTTGVTRRLLTIEEYERMGEAGVFRPDERVELIEGELVTMAPIGSKHAATVTDLHEWFMPRLPRTMAVRVQNPIRIPPRSEPEPDVAIVRRRPDSYAAGHPLPDDVLLVIEVSDTTIRYDRTVKVPLYAAGSIPEAWVVDLPRRRVIVYRQPVDGAYRDVTILRDGALSPLAFPDLSIRLEEIVG